MAKPADAQPQNNSDNHDIHRRLEWQIHLILEEMEDAPDHFSLKDRLSLVQIVGMYLTRDIKLKAANESDTGGSAVRKYSGAFQTHVAGSRARSARSASRPVAVARGNDSDTEPDEPEAA